MNKYELLGKFKSLIIEERAARAKRLAEDGDISEEAWQQYTAARKGDDMEIDFVEFIVQMDEKLDKILEKLG